MPAETLNGRRPPQTPENSVTDNNQFFENILQLRAKYRLRQHYANLSAEDRNLPSQEPQEIESQSIEMAPGLIIIPQIKEAGYDVLMEINRLFRNINSGLSVEAVANELEVNLRTYDLEIIKSRPVLPHLNRFDFKNGVLRMVGNNGEPVVGAISAKERNGSVLEASAAIESFLLSAKNNSFAVLMNPAGWNGFTDEYGNEAEPHLNAEIMVFWKDQKGQLKGLTLVAGLEEEQARKMMASLGVSGQLLGGKTEQERLSNIVRNPALVSLPEAYGNPFMYVLDKMLTQRGSGDFWLRMRKGLPEVRTVMEVKQDIVRFEELLLLSQEEEKLAGNPKKYILENAAKLGDKSVQQELINKIEKAILLLTREYRQNSKQVMVYQPSGVIYAQDDFSVEIAFLKTRAGCPASIAARILGGSSLGIESSGATMPSTVTFTELKDKDFCIKCGACGEYIWRVVRHGQKCPKCPAIRRC